MSLRSYPERLSLTCSPYEIRVAEDAQKMRQQFALKLIQLADMDDLQLARQYSDDEFLIVQGYRRRYAPNNEFVVAHSYVEQLDLVRQYKSAGIDLSMFADQHITTEAIS